MTCNSFHSSAVRWASEREMLQREQHVYGHFANAGSCTATLALGVQISRSLWFVWLSYFEKSANKYQILSA